MNIQNVGISLTCPVDFEPLFQAVTLNCGHNINETPAKQLFGNIYNNRCLKSGNCPLCQRVVLVYYPNYTLRELARSFFASDEKIEQTIDREEKKELSYPGIKAKFYQKSGNWEFFNLGRFSSLCKQIYFTSITPNSLFNTISLCGYIDGSLKMFVTIRNGNFDIIKDYLIDNQIFLEDFSSFYGCFERKNLKKMFYLLANNNEFPETIFQKFKEIVDSGKCELTEEEIAWYKEKKSQDEKEYDESFACCSCILQ